MGSYSIFFIIVGRIFFFFYNIKYKNKKLRLWKYDFMLRDKHRRTYNNNHLRINFQKWYIDIFQKVIFNNYLIQFSVATANND